MENYLVITALGRDKPGIVDKLTETVANCSCNVVDSRMTVLGGEFAVILMAAGKWNELTKLEDALQALREPLELTITCKRTEPDNLAKDLMPYSVEVISIDHPGIVYELAHFFPAAISTSRNSIPPATRPPIRARPCSPCTSPPTSLRKPVSPRYVTSFWIFAKLKTWMPLSSQ